MYCSLCGEIIDPEDVLSDDMCDGCFTIINSGEEISEDELLEELNTYLEKSSNMSDYEKVMYILNKEYGYVLTSLQNKHNAEIISINISDIVQLNEEYYVKVNNHNKVNDLYKELYSNDDKMDFQKFPVCVLLKEGDKYRVIDGYHRLFVARTSDYGEIIKVIVIY